MKFRKKKRDRGPFAKQACRTDLDHHQTSVPSSAQAFKVQTAIGSGITVQPIDHPDAILPFPTIAQAPKAAKSRPS